MRTKNEPDADEAGRKCFFCGKPVDDDTVLWISQHAITHWNKRVAKGMYKFGSQVTPNASNSIVLHPACSIQLGQRLMVDGFKSHKISFRASLAVLKMHLESHKGDPDE